jgi:hypothetical protein
VAVYRHGEAGEMSLLGEAAARGDPVDLREEPCQRTPERARQRRLDLLRRQRRFQPADRIEGVMQGAGGEFRARRQGLDKGGGERSQRGQHAVQAVAAAFGGMHTLHERDYPVQLVLARGREPEETRAEAQRMEEQQ